MSKFDSPWSNLLSKFLLTINLLIASKFREQFFSLSIFRGLWYSLVICLVESFPIMHISKICIVKPGPKMHICEICIVMPCLRPILRGNKTCNKKQNLQQVLYFSVLAWKILFTKPSSRQNARSSHRWIGRYVATPPPFPSVHREKSARHCWICDSWSQRSAFGAGGVWFSGTRTCCKFCWPPRFNKTCTRPTTSLDNKNICVPTPAAL